MKLVGMSLQVHTVVPQDTVAYNATVTLGREEARTGLAHVARRGGVRQHPVPRGAPGAAPGRLSAQVKHPF